MTIIINGYEVDPDDPQPNWYYSTYKECGWRWADTIRPKDDYTHWMHNSPIYDHYEIVVVMEKGQLRSTEGLKYIMVPFTCDEALLGWANG